jgi:hypothetical protein
MQQQQNEQRFEKVLEEEILESFANKKIFFIITLFFPNVINNTLRARNTQASNRMLQQTIDSMFKET